MKIPLVILLSCLAVLVPGARAQTVAVLDPLHAFDGADGSYPLNLLEGSDGNLYGTTATDGDAAFAAGGTVFQLTPGGTLTTLNVFDGFDPQTYINTGGATPASLIQGVNGNLYGTTQVGGAHGGGTAFALTTTGALTVLHEFTPGADGSSPAALVQGRDGNLYGVTASGGGNGDGTVFRLTPGGTFTTLGSFGASAGLNSAPPTLIAGTDGNLYGTTGYNGANGQGTVFTVTPDGVLSTLHDFSALDGTGANADGGGPDGALVEGGDGNFYGTAYEGGANGQGTVFRITPTGVLTALHSFAADENGRNPFGRLVLGNDGNFYGATADGGPANLGTIFSTTPGGVFSTLYRVGSGDGVNQPASLLETRAGTFYVTSGEGNKGGNGTVFALSFRTETPPTAMLTVTTGKVRVGSGTPGVVTVNLSAAFVRNVVIRYTVGGSAVNGTDDAALGGTVKIKAGETSAAIRVTPQGDLGGDAKRVVKLALAPGKNYVVASTAPVKVKLLAAGP